MTSNLLNKPRQLLKRPKVCKSKPPKVVSDPLTCVIMGDDTVPASFLFLGLAAATNPDFGPLFFPPATITANRGTVFFTGMVFSGPIAEYIYFSPATIGPDQIQLEVNWPDGKNCSTTFDLTVV